MLPAMTILRTASTLAALALAFAAPPALAQEAAPTAPEVELVPGVALVRFQADVDPAERERVFRAAGVEVDHAMGLEDAYEVTFPETRDPRDVARDLAAQPGVRWAEPDVYGEFLGVPTEFPEPIPQDAEIAKQWPLAKPGATKALDVRRAWGITEGNPA